MGNEKKSQNNRKFQPVVCVSVAAALLTGGVAGYDIWQRQPDKPPAVSLGLTTELTAPVFSAAGGCYQDTLRLTLSTATTGGRIFYTTDGTDPTAESTEYLLPLEIADRSAERAKLARKKGISANGNYTPEEEIPKGTVIRAATMDAAGNFSEAVTETYLIGLDYGDTPVVSLVTDPDNLFDDATGIYCLGDTYKEWRRSPEAVGAESWEAIGNYSQRGREWERPILFTIYETDGTSFSQNLGARIMGNASRSYYQKSLRLFARTDYGEKRVDYALIPDSTDTAGKTIEKYKSVLLRCGGNDSDYAKLRDPFIQELVSDRSIATQDSRPVVAFLNGEYWGVYALQTDYSDNWVQYHYGVPNEDVVSIKTGKVEDGTDEDLALFENFMKFVESGDFSDDKLYEQLCQQMDVQSFIDYYCTQIIIGNKDGPTEGNNWRLWRSRTKTDTEWQDGKWRWMLFDTEFSLGLYEEGKNYRINSMKAALQSESEMGILLNQLLENDGFRAQFVNTYLDLFNVNFEPGHTYAVLSELREQYEPLMPEQFNRFGPDWVVEWKKPYESYYSEQISQIQSYLANRNTVLVQHLIDALEPEATPVTLTISGAKEATGTVRLNTVTLPVAADGSWSGTYLSGCELTLTATPAEGFSFDCWSGDSDSTSETITVSLEKARTFTPIFEKI